MRIDKACPRKAFLLTTSSSAWLRWSGGECFWQTHFSAPPGLLVSTESGSQIDGTSQGRIIKAHLDGPGHIDGTCRDRWSDAVVWRRGQGCLQENMLDELRQTRTAARLHAPARRCSSHLDLAVFWVCTIWQAGMLTDWFPQTWYPGLMILFVHCYPADQCLWWMELDIEEKKKA